jgi:hypothetical protein
MAASTGPAVMAIPVGALAVGDDAGFVKPGAGGGAEVHALNPAIAMSGRHLRRPARGRTADGALIRGLSLITATGP